MRRRDRIAVLLAVLLFIGLAKIGQQVYRWQAFSAERVAIGRLEGELELSALGVIGTQITADSLRRAILDADETLGAAQRRLDRVDSDVLGTSLPRAQEMVYRRNLGDYNEQVARRNELVKRWRETLEENHVHVDRYNAVADSIRGLADRMGEPFYPIRSPAEIAATRGLVNGEG